MENGWRMGGEWAENEWNKEMIKIHVEWENGNQVTCN